MKIGATFKKVRQRYECVGFEDYVNRNSHQSTLIFLQSHCADCGAPFCFYDYGRAGKAARGQQTMRTPQASGPAGSS
jgi:hypothetical protein